MIAKQAVGETKRFLKMSYTVNIFEKKINIFVFSRLLLHYFYQWKLLPAVMKLEKAKEEKKRKWREKVWEILPDYTPAVED